MITISFRLTDGSFHELIIDKLANFIPSSRREPSRAFLSATLHTNTTRLHFIKPGEVLGEHE